MERESLLRAGEEADDEREQREETGRSGGRVTSRRSSEGSLMVTERRSESCSIRHKLAAADYELANHCDGHCFS